MISFLSSRIFIHKSEMLSWPCPVGLSLPHQNVASLCSRICSCIRDLGVAAFEFRFLMCARSGCSFFINICALPARGIHIWLYFDIRTDYNLCPSEKVAGKPMPVLRQIRKGLVARFRRTFFRESFVSPRCKHILSTCRKSQSMSAFQLPSPKRCSLTDIARLHACMQYLREPGLLSVKRKTSSRCVMFCLYGLIGTAAPLENSLTLQDHWYLPVNDWMEHAFPKLVIPT